MNIRNIILSKKSRYIKFLKNEFLLTKIIFNLWYSDWMEQYEEDFEGVGNILYFDLASV